MDVWSNNHGAQLKNARQNECAEFFVCPLWQSSHGMPTLRNAIDLAPGCHPPVRSANQKNRHAGTGECYRARASTCQVENIQYAWHRRSIYFPSSTTWTWWPGMPKSRPTPGNESGREFHLRANGAPIDSAHRHWGNGNELNGIMMGNT